MQGRVSFPSPRSCSSRQGLLYIQQVTSRPNGPKPEAKAARGWSARGWGGSKTLAGRRPLRPGSGTGWLTFRKATHCARRPRPRPQTLAVQNSLLADGLVLLYLFPHSLLCVPAKNLPVISKLRQKVPPVLSAVNKRLPLHKNDSRRTQTCAAGLPSPPLQRPWETNAIHR